MAQLKNTTITGTLDVSGNTTLSGTTTGDLTVTGNFTMTDTQWTDLRFPATQTKIGSNLKPDFDETELALLFPENDETEKIYMLAQFGHDRKNGSDIHPHIHYIQESSDIPVFYMKYRWQDNGEVVPAWTTIESNGAVFPYTTGTTMLQIIGFNHIDGSAATAVSSMMDIIVYRKTGDGVSGDIIFKEFDIHYQMDSIGSDEEYVK